MIICCGEALIDMIRMQVPGQGNGFFPTPGGSPYNAAIAIGRLGAPVSFLGRFSTDFFGRLLVSTLRENNVNDSLIIRTDLNSTLAFVTVDSGGEPQYVFYTGETAGASLFAEDLPPILPVDTSCILFGSIAMTMEPIASTIENFVFKNNTDGSPVISFDPNVRPFMIQDRQAYTKRFEKWTAAAVIVKISSADCEYIYPHLSTEQSAEKILGMGPRLVLCTLGTAGAKAFLRRDNGTVCTVSAAGIPVTVADTVGAGDTFHGAFLARLALDGKMSRQAVASLSATDLHGALEYANRAAAIVCSRQGAQPPTTAEMDKAVW